MKFEELHLSFRYLVYLCLSYFVVWIFSGMTSWLLSTNNSVVLATSLFTTIFSLMDSAWNRIGEDASNPDLLGSQIARFVGGFFIFGMTLVLIGWIIDIYSILS